MLLLFLFCFIFSWVCCVFAVFAQSFLLIKSISRKYFGKEFWVLGVSVWSLFLVLFDFFLLLVFITKAA